MIKVAGGAFLMGSTEWLETQPVQKIQVPGFYLAKYPVTQELWQSVMGDNPANFKGKTNPVERVSWDDTQLFLEKLNQICGQNYRLPSEAEWEYTARGGRVSQGLRYAGSNKLKEVGWYDTNSHGETKPVGLKQANELGFYDMSGNIREWCADHWHDNYQGIPKDGSAWVKGGYSDRRVVRGGSWFFDDYFCAVSYRDWYYSNFRYYFIGFRLARY
ncbi:MAG: formylglycine-generating enzyme family protein [Saprospiraceae bacterium]|nr:formylglycine-generating enzyme family protein [Saprospiraceae bacterium]